MAGSPVTRAMSAARGPSATTARPWRPRDAQDSFEAALPERSGSTGGWRPDPVMPLLAAAALVISSSSGKMTAPRASRTTIRVTVLTVVSRASQPGSTRRRRCPIR